MPYAAAALVALAVDAEARKGLMLLKAMREIISDLPVSGLECSRSEASDLPILAPSPSAEPFDYPSTPPEPTLTPLRAQ